MNNEYKVYKQKKDFAKTKRYITKRFPGAHTIQRPDGSFKVVDGRGISVVDQELMIPPTKTVLDAWEAAKYSAWFSNMINKSNRAFSDDKILKKLSKKLKD
jgi:hypothetical protein